MFGSILQPDVKLFFFVKGVKVYAHRGLARSKTYIPTFEDELFPTLKPLSHWCNIASLLIIYHYLHGKYSDELHSLILPV